MKQFVAICNTPSRVHSMSVGNIKTTMHEKIKTNNKIKQIARSQEFSIVIRSSFTIMYSFFDAQWS